MDEKRRGREAVAYSLSSERALMFLSYLFTLALIGLDYISFVLNLHIIVVKGYWIVVEWFYPIYSSIAFFILGRANARTFD
jgi:hypothetical protein